MFLSPTVKWRGPELFSFSSFFLKARSCRSRKALLVLFVRPSVIINSSSHWAGFGEIYCWRILWKSVEKIQTCLKSKKKTGHFIRRPKYIYIVDSSTKYFARIQQWKWNLLWYFLGGTQLFCIVDSDFKLNMQDTLLCFSDNNGHAIASQCYVIRNYIACLGSLLLLSRPVLNGISFFPDVTVAGSSIRLLISF